MKYVIRPLALINILVFALLIAILAVAVITPSVILDFLKAVTPDTEEELRLTYLLLTAVGAVVLFFVLRHKKPYKFKGRKAKNSR